MSEAREQSRVNAGRSRASIIGLGLLGLLGMLYLLWPKQPALVEGEPTPTGSTWQLRAPEHKALITGPTMGTRYTVVLAGDELEAAELEIARARVDEVLAAVNAEMSTYLDDSELSRFNQRAAGVEVELSEQLLAVLVDAELVAEASDGAFDVTVGPLVDAWGFGAGSQGPDQPPSDAELEALRAHVGRDKLELDRDAKTLRKSVDGVEVDLSAIAKGHGCDRVAAALDELGYQNYMVEVGGELRLRGQNPDGALWKVGVERPTEGERNVQKILQLTDVAVATSGDYRNYWEHDGVRYSHTIDPRTGRPITHALASVTVVHPSSAALADAWATALDVLGPEQGLALAEREGLAAYFLVHSDEGFEARSSSAFDKFLD